jgi:hypothetical protein
MPRITVNVSEEAEAWLQDQADALGVSKARAGGHCIEVMHSTVDYINLNRDAVTADEGATDAADVAERVDDLEARVAALETAEDSATDTAESDAGADAPESVETPSETRPSQPSHTREAPPAPADDDLAERVRAHLEDQPPRKAHGKDAVVDVFRELRRDGPLRTGEIQDRVHPAYSDHYADGRTMWQSISRYLEDVPGVEKGDYGEWAYTGDDAVRAALGGDRDGASGGAGGD